MASEVPIKRLRYKDYRPRFTEEDDEIIIEKAARHRVSKNLLIHNMVKCFLMLPEQEQIELLAQVKKRQEEYE